MSLLKDILKKRAASPELLKFLENNTQDYVAIYANEPARYYFQENDKEYWNIAEDLPNIAPPFNTMWIEFSAPDKIVSKIYGESDYPDEFWSQAGVLLTANDNSDGKHPLNEIFPDARWIISGHVFVKNDKILRGWVRESLQHSLTALAWQQLPQLMQSKMRFLSHEEQEAMIEENVTAQVNDIMNGIPNVIQMVTIWYGVKSDGQLVLQDGRGYLTLPGEGIREHFELTQEGLEVFKDYTDNVIKIALLTVYFIHAKGVELKNVPGKRKGKKRRKPKKGKRKAPEIRFKTVDIGLDVQRDIEAAKRQGGGVLRALHLRRGHFKTFNKPMFGREGGKTGAVWIRPHIVGKKELGEIKKAYRVRKPEDDMPSQRNPIDDWDDWDDDYDDGWDDYDHCDLCGSFDIEEEYIPLEDAFYVFCLDCGNSWYEH